MQANAETMVVVLIEDIVAVRNLDEILEVDHIDVFHVAFADLAQSMGYLHDLANVRPAAPLLPISFVFTMCLTSTVGVVS